MISRGYRCPLYDDDAAATTTDLDSDQATHQLDSAIASNQAIWRLGDPLQRTLVLVREHKRLGEMQHPSWRPLTLAVVQHEYLETRCRVTGLLH